MRTYYIANGKWFKTYQEVVNYAASMGMRVCNTEIKGGNTICTLTTMS